MILSRTFVLLWSVIICCGSGLLPRVQSCQMGRFGFNCQGVCHCRNSNECDEFSGSCQPAEGCATGFYGLGCQYSDIELASGKQAEQSSTKFRAGNANDGSIDTFSATLNETNPWWRVDLGSVYIIKQVSVRIIGQDLTTCKITQLGKEYTGTKSTTISGYTCQRWESQRPNRHRFHADQFPAGEGFSGANNYCRNPETYPLGPWCYTTDGPRFDICNIPDCPSADRLGDLAVRVGQNENVHNTGELCFVHSGPVGGPAKLISQQCERSLSGQYISIRIKRDNAEELALTEVAVYGYQPTPCTEGSFGPDCVFKCHCLSDRGCDSDTGACGSGCAYGYKGIYCYTIRPQLANSPTVYQKSTTSNSIRIQFRAWSSTSKNRGEGNVIGYLVQYRKSDDPDIDSNWQNSSRLTTNGLIVAKTITNLTFNTYYVFRVIVLDEDDKPGLPGPSSSSYSVKTNCTNPAPAGSLHLSSSVDQANSTLSQITVTWEAPSCTGCDLMSGYIVMWNRLGATHQAWNEKIYVALDVGPEMNMIIRYLPPFTDYNVKIQAYNNEGFLTESVIKTIKTSKRQDSANSSLIAGVVAALITLALLVLLFIVFMYMRRQTRRLKSPENNRKNSDNRTFTHVAKTNADEEIHMKHKTKEMLAYEKDQSPAPPPSDQSSIDENSYEEHDLYVNSVVDGVKPVGQIKVLCYKDYLKDKKNEANNSLRKEYLCLPRDLQSCHSVASKQQNKRKNRYQNIVAYDHNRIIMEKIENDPFSDYINASYINGYQKPKRYIATQGPNKYSKNDIWRMAWENMSDRIVMVSNLIEDGRFKCELYWPEDGSIECHDLTVTLSDVTKMTEFTIRTFSVKKTGDGKNNTRTIRQFHFTRWPDHGVPRFGTTLLAFRKKVRSYDNHKSGPIIVHCSAGVGRTGTFIALDYCLDQADEIGEINPFDCVARLREQRVNMVQTEQQYIFFHDVLLEAFICPRSSFPCPEATDRFAAIRERNSATNISVIDNQYEALSIVTKYLEPKETATAATNENSHKNRDMKILPNNRNRPYLLTQVDGGSDYINAVFVDGYKQKDAFIVTQMPLPCTVTDFWRMMYDHDSHTIVMLNEMDKNDSTNLPYWPDSGSWQVGPFTITLKSAEKSNKHVTIRNLNLNYKEKSKEETRTIRHFQFHGWAATEETPTSHTEFLDLIDQVEHWQQNSGNNSITVHCLDGVQRSGVYLGVVGTCEKIKLEREVDVFQTVKQIRENRPQFITSSNQFEFIYEAVIGYMESFETYANFK